MIDYLEYIRFAQSMSAKTRYRLSHFFKKIPACQRLRLKNSGIHELKKEQIFEEN